MSDIVERLRAYAVPFNLIGEGHTLADEAAAEIERLQALVKDLADEIVWLRAEKETRHQMIKTLMEGK